MKVPVPRPISSPSASTSRNPAPFRHDPTRSHRLGEMQVESRGQQKAVGDEGVGGVKGRIIQHLEIDSAMRRAGRMKAAFINREGNLRRACTGHLQR